MAQKIQVGDKVRSFDFAEPGESWGRDLEGDRACYVEGVVVGFADWPDCKRYQIRVDRRVFGGKEKPIRDPEVFPPVNGTPSTMGGVTDGVEKV
jgi:hypothetical protein